LAEAGPAFRSPTLKVKLLPTGCESPEITRNETRYLPSGRAFGILTRTSRSIPSTGPSPGTSEPAASISFRNSGETPSLKVSTTSEGDVARVALATGFDPRNSACAPANSGDPRIATPKARTRTREKKGAAGRKRFNSPELAWGDRMAARCAYAPLRADGAISLMKGAGSFTDMGGSPGLATSIQRISPFAQPWIDLKYSIFPGSLGIIARS